MASAVIIEIEGASLDIYEAVNEKFGTDDWSVDDIPGLILHSIGQTDTGLVNVEIWESSEQFEEHVMGRVVPAIKEVAPDVTPNVRIVELHKLLR